MCSDLFDRVGVVVKDVLKSSEITMVSALIHLQIMYFCSY